MLERLLCGEYSVGKRCFAEVLMRAPLGIPLISYVGELMNSAGDRKISPGAIFPWQLAEDNPVISWWGNNL